VSRNPFLYAAVNADLIIAAKDRLRAATNVHDLGPTVTVSTDDLILVGRAFEALLDAAYGMKQELTSERGTEQ